MKEKILQAIQTADTLYHRLVLLVGTSGAGKTGVLQEVAAASNTAVVNLNLAVTRELLAMTVKQRRLQLPVILGQIVIQAQSPVVLDNIEILFARELKQNPLRLLQGISRNRPVVAAWNGRMDGKRLVYAEPGHPEYCNDDAAGTQILTMTAPPEANNTAIPK